MPSESQRSIAPTNVTFSALPNSTVTRAATALHGTSNGRTTANLGSIKFRRFPAGQIAGKVAHGQEMRVTRPTTPSAPAVPPRSETAHREFRRVRAGIADLLMQRGEFPADPPRFHRFRSSFGEVARGRCRRRSTAGLAGSSARRLGTLPSGPRSRAACRGRGVTTCPRPSGVKAITSRFDFNESNTGCKAARSAIGSIRAARPRSSPTVWSPRSNSSVITANSTLSTPSQSYR